MKHTLGDGSNCELVDDSKSEEKKPVNPKEPVQRKDAPLAIRRGTGPRTPQGKQRAKNNALTFGIFSRVAVLPGESQEEFDTMLSGLLDHFQPLGMLEATLVGKLATGFWRYLRFLKAEGAEIQAGTEFVEWNQRERYREEAARFPQLQCNGGLIRRISNPEALAGCLNLLQQLRERIEEVGFNSEWDDKILTKVYGEYDQQGIQDGWQHGLRSSYIELATAAALPDNVHSEGGFESVETYKRSFIAKVKDEIKQLEGYKSEQATVLSTKLKLESLRRSVPDGPGLDRLLRYAAAVSRDIERTLNQLDRIQRARLAQPTPPIDLNVSSSME